MKESRSPVKQVIVMRKDLGMRKGKMMAQASHAALNIFLDRMIVTEAEKTSYVLHLTEEMVEWLHGYQTKIAVSVPSEEALLSVYEQAKEKGLPVALITDAGLTEFNGVPTKTCIAIGPANSEAIDAITGHLPLL